MSQGLRRALWGLFWGFVRAVEFCRLKSSRIAVGHYVGRYGEILKVCRTIAVVAISLVARMTAVTPGDND